MRRYVEKYWEKSGTSPHPDPEVASAVVLGLAANVEEVGRPLCPCNFYPDKDAELRDHGRRWLCACDEMKKWKYCHCLLFVNADGMPITECLPEDHEGRHTTSATANDATYNCGMHAEIISIGTELTTGQNLDTNSQWLSRRLAEIGIEVGWHSTVADNFDANVDVFATAVRRAKLVIATGGLGPTQDDLTREVLAKVAGVGLEFHEPSFEHIKNLFASRGRQMPERNRVQAMFPAGSEVVFNAHGTAPGIWMTIGGATVVALPGVPSELYSMFESEVKPRLVAKGAASGEAGGVQIERKISTFGLGESHIEEKLFDLTRRGRVPEVGITASDAIISLRIIAKAASLTAADELIAPVERTIRERLGDLVFAVGDDTMQAAVLRLLAERKQTLATAESLTGGLVAHRLSQVPGASDWYKGGVVSYTNAAKMSLLGVPEDMLDKYTAVSAPVAEAMAVGIRQRLGTDLAVSTTGYAGPTGDPVGMTFVGLAWAGGASSTSFHWFGNRTEIQSRAATMALNRVRLFLGQQVG